MTTRTVEVVSARYGELWDPRDWDEHGPSEPNPPGWYWRKGGEWFGPFESEEAAEEDAHGI